MRLITYQRKEAVDILLSTGELKITDTNNMLTYHFFDDCVGGNRFKEGYDYIFNRMNRYIKDKSDYTDDIISPIWGWYKYPDINELNTDNCDLYRIELEIDDGKVLLSDFDYYENVVIAGIDFIYTSDKKRQEIYERASKEGIEVIYKLYDKMINKSHLRKASYIQATFYCLKKEYVISIEKVCTDVIDEFVIDKDTLIGYKGRNRDLVIPDGVKNIASRALAHLDIDSVVIPSSVNHIDYYAFKCSEVKIVKILGIDTLISPEAFDHCYELTDIYFVGTEEQFNNNILTNDDYEHLQLYNDVNIHYMYKGE